MFDVVIIGAGPAGLYSSIVLKRGIPTQSLEEKEISVCILEKGHIGGLSRYAHIQISKSWSFSGSNLANTLYQECKQLNVNIYSKLQLQVSHPDKSSSYRILGIHSVCPH
ncbi:hypothetical protein [Macrococcus carouselicus]|uniref:Uncharacterized protein n=1 Tax=Macrococcus carouselicus TaxID=69969 RepID=A0A9Q8FR72_9STAP|nr:hypothetical protein [Macrococcus carouselicus]TDM03769.1 hypothetical protein ERX40_00985 [Macrococcus carouselicus]